MILPDDQIIDIGHQVHGHLDPAEMVLLYRTAVEVSASGAVVEIGSYQGRSTVLFGLARRPYSSKVYAIDARTGMGKKRDYEIMYGNISKYGLLDKVEIITAKSSDYVANWSMPISLLFIDGAHDYESVKQDFAQWSPFVTDKIAVHDVTADHPGVLRALGEFMDGGGWKYVGKADSTNIIERR